MAGGHSRISTILKNTPQLNVSGIRKSKGLEMTYSAQRSPTICKLNPSEQKSLVFRLSEERCTESTSLHLCQV